MVADRLPDVRMMLGRPYTVKRKPHRPVAGGIPTGVYYDEAKGGRFLSSSHNVDLGHVFRKKWLSRAAEFPKRP